MRRGISWIFAGVVVAVPIAHAPASALSRKEPLPECPSGARWREEEDVSKFKESGMVPGRVGWCEGHDGRRQGPMRTWWPNGWLRSERHFEGGEETGVAKTYFDNGHPETEVNLVAGRMEGRFVQWHVTGQRARVMHYDAGRPHGWSTHWNEAGRVVDQGAFTEGRKEGVWEAFHDNGVLREVARWERGALQGRQLQLNEGGAFALGACWSGGERRWETKNESEARTRRCEPW
jgi:antitoxin component YwqK of YwqJK toxin-antitoxin module